MALVAETGEGLSTAESYISVADADARQTALGVTDWTGTDAAKEVALRLATNYMEGAYRNAWKGTRLKREQALSWPRYGAFVDGFDVLSTIVPQEVKNACADLAVKALTETLAPDLERGIKREKIGPIETEFDTFSPQSKRYRSIEMGLAAYLRASASSAMLVRA